MLYPRKMILTVKLAWLVLPQIMEWYKLLQFNHGMILVAPMMRSNDSSSNIWNWQLRYLGLYWKLLWWDKTIVAPIFGTGSFDIWDCIGSSDDGIVAAIFGNGSFNIWNWKLRWWVEKQMELDTAGGAPRRQTTEEDFLAQIWKYLLTIDFSICHSLKEGWIDVWEGLCPGLDLPEQSTDGVQQKLRPI